MPNISDLLNNFRFIGFIMNEKIKMIHTKS